MAEFLRKPLRAPSFLHIAEHLLCVNLYVQLLFCLMWYYEISHIIKSFWWKKEFQWLDILYYDTYLNHLNLFLTSRFPIYFKLLNINFEYPFLAICSVFKMLYIEESLAPTGGMRALFYHTLRVVGSLNLDSWGSENGFLSYFLLFLLLMKLNAFPKYYRMYFLFCDFFLFFKIHFIDYAITVVLIFPPLPPSTWYPYSLQQFLP